MPLYFDLAAASALTTDMSDPEQLAASFEPTLSSWRPMLESWANEHMPDVLGSMDTAQLLQRRDLVSNTLMLLNDHHYQIQAHITALEHHRTQRYADEVRQYNEQLANAAKVETDLAPQIREAALQVEALRQKVGDGREQAEQVQRDIAENKAVLEDTASIRSSIEELEQEWRSSE